MVDSNKNNEAGINLWDLLFFLIRHWKSLIAMIIIGIALGGGLFFAKGRLSSEAKVESNSLTEEIPISYKTELGMQTASNLRKLIEKKQKYFAESHLMNLDTANVYFGRIHFDFMAGEYVSVVNNSFDQMVHSEDFIAPLCEAQDVITEPQYMSELYEVAYRMPERDENGEGKSDGLGAITISIKCGNKNALQKILVAAKRQIDGFQNTITVKVPEYSCIGEVESSIFQTHSAVTESAQSGIIDSIDSHRRKLAEIENGFSEEDMDYYQRVYLGESPEEALAADESKEEPVFNAKKVLKGMVLGLAGFLLLWGAWLVMLFAVSDKIRADEVSTTYQIEKLGYIKGAAGPRFIVDKLIEKAYDTVFCVDESEACIGNVLRCYPEKNILICKDLCSANNDGILDALKIDDKSFTYSDLLTNVSGELDQVSAYEGLIYVVYPGKTSRKTMEREIQICKRKNINILGIVEVH